MMYMYYDMDMEGKLPSTFLTGNEVLVGVIQDTGYLSYKFQGYEKFGIKDIEIYGKKDIWISSVEVALRRVLRGSPELPTRISKQKCMYLVLPTSSGSCASLIRKRGYSTRFWRSMANGTRQSRTELPIQEFCLPFAQTVDQPVFPCLSQTLLDVAFQGFVCCCCNCNISTNISRRKMPVLAHCKKLFLFKV